LKVYAIHDFRALTREVVPLPFAGSKNRAVATHNGSPRQAAGQSNIVEMCNSPLYAPMVLVILI
jgi:hypothetical protein